MKIKKIIDLCKKRGIFRLYAGESVQWISDGCALYPLYNLPEFDEETLYRVFDITEKQQDKISFRYELHLPSAICIDDYMQGEALCEKGTMVIGAGGKKHHSVQDFTRGAVHRRKIPCAIGRYTGLYRSVRKNRRGRQNLLCGQIGIYASCNCSSV